MCGLAGYSLAPDAPYNRTLTTQALLAGIAERGADAVGYAYRDPGGGAVTVVKQQTPASELIDRVAVPTVTQDLMVHVRDYTKGHPSIAANNHPVVHGPVAGIHNGIILNDDELLEPHDCARTEHGMTVDSEAIFAIAAHSESDPRALEALHGAMAAAWMDERHPDMIYLARGVGRPLWLGEARHGVFFASTERALAVLEGICGIQLRTQELADGTFIALRHGRVERRERFATHDYVEDDPLPSVRAPHEADSCLRRLALIAAAA